jgi:hypothetical protein
MTQLTALFCSAVVDPYKYRRRPPRQCGPTCPGAGVPRLIQQYVWPSHDRSVRRSCTVPRLKTLSSLPAIMLPIKNEKDSMSMHARYTINSNVYSSASVAPRGGTCVAYTSIRCVSPRAVDARAAARGATRWTRWTDAAILHVEAIEPRAATVSDGSAQRRADVRV